MPHPRRFTASASAGDLRAQLHCLAPQTAGMAVTTLGAAPVPHENLRPLGSVASGRPDPRMRPPAARPTGVRTLAVRRPVNRPQTLSADPSVAHANNSTLLAEATQRQTASRRGPRTRTILGLGGLCVLLVWRLQSPQ